MSQRDQACRTGSVSYSQELTAAVRGLLKQADWSQVTFRADCRWQPSGLVLAALLWTWSSKAALGERLEQALRVTRGLGRRCAPKQTSYRAFLKLLVRWTCELRAVLLVVFHRTMEREFPGQFRHAGFVVLGGDGSKLQLARTVSNERGYSPQSRGKKGKQRRRARRARRRPRTSAAQAQRSREKKADSPQMALTLLFHVMLRLPWDWRLGSSDVSEREHLRQMLASLPPDALIVLDAGFVGYELWTELLASGRPFVIRVGGNVRLLKKLGVARESHGTVYLWPDKAAKRRQPPLALRLVQVHDGRQAWSLVTSVRDAKRLSDRHVAEIYGFRWRIELFFRHFKQTFGRAKLRSHKAEHAACEAEWSLWGLWALLLHAQQKHQSEWGAPARLSVARVLRAVRQALDEHRCRPEPGQSLREQLLAAVIDSYRRRNKTSRGYPRQKYEPPTQPPQIKTATPAQRQWVKQVLSRRMTKGFTA
jgi:Transposase DDE domain